MRQALLGSWLAGLLVLVLTNASSAGGGEDAKANDQAIHAALKDVVNHGATLFNRFGDHYGCYRVYDGALRSLRPLLGRHPDLQKAIDEGLESAEQMANVAQRAFALRRVIDQVRSRLGGASPPVSEKQQPLPDKKNGEVKPKKEEKKLPPGTAKVAGRMTFSTGIPAPSGYLTLIAPDQAKFSAFIQADGKFAFKTPIPEGTYVVTIEPALKDDPLGAKNVPIPAYYRDAVTSPLRVEVRSGGQDLEIRLAEPGQR